MEVKEEGDYSLHRLPTEQSIEYKLSLLCFKTISH